MIFPIQSTFSFYSKGKLLTMNTMLFYTYRDNFSMCPDSPRSPGPFAQIRVLPTRKRVDHVCYLLNTQGFHQFYISKLRVLHASSRLNMWQGRNTRTGTTVIILSFCKYLRSDLSYFFYRLQHPLHHTGCLKQETERKVHLRRR